ncbi:MFS transporter [Pseudomonas frederiksbergensis]|uniref:MFS transporter n=1 Tax=Pseudomonas frederiksbergensis TaxID=104087 RepID=UPI00095877C2|nr:MFS transporter [Pseudomonas frederiksbergensis]APV42074.1 MFS transporter [Pseudomonas frederiksbergensis]
MHRTINPSSELAAIYRKIDWRLLPFLLLCYVVAYLDRVNVGFAKLQMQSDLNLSDAAYGLGAGIFFIGYALFETPSNLLLPKVGARKTLSRVMILWGITSACMLFVESERSFYLLRLLLGIFEAGFAPGMIFYLTYWYGRERLGRVMAIVMLAGPLGGMFGAPLSAWLMTTFAGVHGLAGWQWMFFLEALPAVVLGVIALKVLSDKPAVAPWLSAREKQVLQAHIGEGQGKHHSFAQVLKDPRVYLMAAGYFCLICGIYTMSFWLPSILKDAGVQGVMQIGLYSAVPYIGAMAGMLIFSRTSDRFYERRWHTAVPALIGAIGLAGSVVYKDHLGLALAFLTLATSMMWVAYTVFWAIPSQHLKGDAAAGGIAVINTIGLTGGFISPALIGYAKTATGNSDSGLLIMAAVLVMGALLLAANRPQPAQQSTQTPQPI